ncbi:MAG: cache domain-containing protein, partial [Thermoguttaceae bacterium]
MTKKYLFTFVVAAMILWCMFVISRFVQNLARIEKSSIHQNLQNNATSNMANLQMTFDNYMNSLEVMATCIEEYEFCTSPQVRALLAKIASNEGYERLAIDDTSGKSYTSDGYEIDVSRFGLAGRIGNGETFIYDVAHSLVDQALLVNLFVPLNKKNGEHKAAIRCALTTKMLSQCFDKSFALPGQGFFLIVDAKGNYVARSLSKYVPNNTNNFYKEIQYMIGESEDMGDQIVDDFANQRTRFINFTDGGQMWTAYYAPVGINEWMMFTAVDSKALIQKQSREHLDNAIFLVVQIILLLCLVILYTYITQKRERNRIVLNEEYFKALASYSGKMIFEWEIVSGKLNALTGRRQIFRNKGGGTIVSD